MKVLFDTQVFDWQINGGISRYFIELLNRLDKKEEIDVLFQCAHSYNTYIQDTKWLQRKPVLYDLDVKGKLSLVKLINQKINRRYSNDIIRRKKQDIFHPTYYDPYFLADLKGNPFVLTVYDLVHEKYWKNTNDPLLAQKKALINAANHIIAISEHTKKDIVEHYHISPENITTIQLASGIDLDSAKHNLADESRADLPVNYLLYVGSRKGYKNFLAFLQEVSPTMLERNIPLVVAGAGPFDTNEKLAIASLKIDKLTHHYPQVNDEFLITLYRHAFVFIFPSLYEGFGLPVLEAMQCGCPVIATDNTSLPEVGGEAALYFDPLVPTDLSKKIDILLSDKVKRKSMIEKGYEQIKKFNWDLTAEKHFQTYQNLQV